MLRIRVLIIHTYSFHRFLRLTQSACLTAKTIKGLEFYFISWQLISALNSQEGQPKEINGLISTPITKTSHSKMLVAGFVNLEIERIFR